MAKDTGTGHNSDISIEFDDLVTLLEEMDDKKKAVDEATGKLRSKLKEILDDQEWHKGGLAHIRKIHSMSETERADFLRTFKPLFSVMLENQWNSELQDMLDGLGNEEERAEEGEEE